MPLTTLAAGPALRSEVNANFALCVLTDTAKTITVTHTWTARQTMTGGATLGAALLFASDNAVDIGAASATRPRTIYAGTDVWAGGLLVAKGAASNVGAGAVGYGGTTQTTVGSAGGASALPATPTGYILVNVAGTNRAVPFYAAS